MAKDAERSEAAKAPEPSEDPGTAKPTSAPSRASEGPTERKSDARRRTRASPPEKATEAPAEPKRSAEKPSGPKALRRPTLEPELARLISVRDAVDRRRPKFVRTASHRYWRIGRRNSWRRPRGLQSKQRRHYGYRPVVVSIGFGSPRRTRGLTPTGFRPVLVRTPDEVKKLDRSSDAAVIARTVGTRRRLVLEETARKLGIHVLNPITRDRKEE